MQTEYTRLENNQLTCRVTLSQDELRALVVLIKHGYVDDNELAGDTDVRKIFQGMARFTQAIASIAKEMLDENMLLLEAGSEKIRINGDHFALHRLSNLPVNPTE